jgi:hypothetical protein
MEPISKALTEPLALEQIEVLSSLESTTADRLQIKVFTNKTLVITNLGPALPTGSEQPLGDPTLIEFAHLIGIRNIELPQAL